VKEKELASAKKKQAKVNLEVKKHETAVKTAERTLDDKVKKQPGSCLHF
jgi:hypothetical protein